MYTSPYGPHNYLGEHANDAAATAFCVSVGFDVSGVPRAGQWYFNTTTSSFWMWSGVTWAELGPNDLASVLQLGNTTGGTPIVVSSGDRIQGEDGPGGNTINVRAGNNTTVGNGAPARLIGGSGGSNPGDTGGDIELEPGNGPGGRGDVIARYGNIVLDQAGATVDGVDVSDHAGRHESGGADEVDGDLLDVDFTPANYTPDSSVPEAVGNADALAAHLKGIDTALTGGGSGQNYSLGVYGRVDRIGQLPATNLGSEIVAASTVLTGFRARRAVAGSSGTTTIELEVNGSPTGDTLSWTAADGAYALKSAVVSVAVTVGDRISFRVTSVESGASDIHIEVNS